MGKDHTEKRKIHSEEAPGSHFNRMPKEIQRIEHGFSLFTLLMVLTLCVLCQNKEGKENSFDFGSSKSKRVLGANVFIRSLFWFTIRQ